MTKVVDAASKPKMVNITKRHPLRLQRAKKQAKGIKFKDEVSFYLNIIHKQTSLS